MFFMQKIIFSKTTLHKFLLLGGIGEYVIDKIYPSIRAIKRKKSLSIFGTVRYNKSITTVKIGNFPENNVDEVYTKFQIAKKISLNGNNPNLILNPNEYNYHNIHEGNDQISIKMILEFYLSKRTISNKYRLNFFNNIRKNSNNLFLQNLKDYKKNDVEIIIKHLLKNNKKATAKNFLNNLLTIFNFALKNLNSSKDSFIKNNIKWLHQLKKIVKYKNKSTFKDKRYKKVIKRVSILNIKQLMLLEKFIDEL